MSFSVTMPALGESVSEGTVTRWLKNEGDMVAVDEPLLEVSTDKVDTEIPSPVAGVLSKIVVGVDQTVAVGAELAIISSDASAPAPSAPAPSAPAPVVETPVAQTPTPTPPPATTPVLDSHLDSDNAILDNFYLIPSGQVLTLQLFRSGSEGTAIISAYICDDGTNPNDLTEPLAISYLAINNDTQPLNIDITGDGTRTVRLRREPAGGGGNREMYVAITGFLT